MTGALQWDIAMRTHFGTDPDEILGMSDWLRLLVDGDADRFSAAVRRAVSSPAQTDVEIRTIRSGVERTFHIAAMAHRNEDGGVERILGLCWDVTETREMTRKLKAQHSLMNVTLASIGDGVITTDTEGRITWMNPVATRLTGWTVEEAKGRLSSTVFRIVHEDTGLPSADPIEACMRLKKAVGLEPETALLTREARLIGVQDSAAPIISEDGRIVGAVLVFHDVSEQRELSKAMEARAMRDPLTGLSNRFEFETRLNAAFKKPLFERERSMQFLIDLDRFKSINDSFGHAAGDAVLRYVSTILGEGLSDNDTVARLGGDEFALLLTDRNPEEAFSWAVSVCERIGRSHDALQVEPEAWSIGASIGVVQLGEEISTTADALRAADIASYCAKHAGGECVRVWNSSCPDMNTLFEQCDMPTRIESTPTNGDIEIHT